MLRQCDTRTLQWADKTMSVMRAEQLEACEKDLTGLPSRCLFEPECSNIDAEKLYELSFFADEDRSISGRALRPALHTVEQLRNRVLHTFVQECALLSVEEHDLLVRAVRRLWCRVEGVGENAVLVMPHQLCASALLLLAGDSHKAVRNIVEQVHDSIENTLYLLGAAQAAGPARHMASLLKDTCAAGHPELITRFLLAGYDYVYDRSGNLLLIHPGLADPDKMMGITNTEMNPEALSKASDSINDLESPLYERMLGLLIDVTRPEITPEDAVEDLIILAKQEVPWKDMLEVLSSLLICQPTPEMRSALKDLSDRVPRGLGLSTSRVQ